jgi:hypothetical protein
MKGRRHQALLPPVILAFREQQALAQQRPKTFQRHPFGKGTLRVDQHLSHIVRVVELPDR